ncbi:uncharacterized protein LOC129807072 isoform X1 [Phlebotomus papatasi]|uniref:uncharacterized protein LOC129807072 isoform X1 n=1 Tax=Phlebotomus papatasi TaxID=29031 RepID=UPI0024836348|nr:uncharacterized protein LOC129807072 isoform X1 [Phlebotomus papatasi]
MEKMEKQPLPTGSDFFTVWLSSPPDKCTKRLLNFGDTLLSWFLISPLAIAHWRGTWDYMDQRPDKFPAWYCFILGGILHTAFALLREPLHDEFSPPSNGNKSLKRTIRRIIVTKLYTYIFSVGSIMHWRGGWAMMELHLGPGVWPAVIVSFITLIPLLFLRSLRNSLAPPYIILLDSKDVAFTFPTRFRVEGARQPLLYVLDCCFSVLIIGSLVVFVWRGVWVFLDLVLYPSDAKLSAWYSLAIGYGIVFITFALQPVMRWTCDKLTGFWRLAIADIFLFFSFIGTVNAWRGIWQLLDNYFLPDQRALSDWLTHGICFILLALMNCANTVLVRGVFLDAEEPGGKCVIFPVYYIRLYFQKERTKKNQKALDTMDKDEGANTLLLIEKPANNVVVVKNINEKNQLNNETTKK